MDFVLRTIFDFILSVVCFLCICGIQAYLVQKFDNPLNNFIPKPTKRAETKSETANKFNKGNQSENNHKNNNPCGQEIQGDKEQNNQQYDCTSTYIFASTWTHFDLFIDKIVAIFIGWFNKIIQLYRVPKLKSMIVLYHPA